jgi:hypothetical protein
MQYLLLIYDRDERWAGGYSPAEMGEYAAFAKEYTGAIRGGNALEPANTAVTVRIRDGKRLATDGPFAETKEQLAGYYLVEAKDAQEAADIAAKLPAARWGSVEVRPIMVFK